MVKTETVTLELPQNIMDLVRATVPNIKGYLEYSLIQAVKGDVENDVFIRENLREKYKLA